MIVATAVGIPVSGLLLWLALRGADLGQVRALLADAATGSIVLAVLAFACVYTVQAMRWRILAGMPGVSRARFVEMVVSGVAVNNVLPGRVGDLLRARWLGVASGLGSGRAFATVVLDRGADVVVLFSFLVVTLPFVADVRWTRSIAVGAVVLVAIFISLLVFARSYVRARARSRRQRGLVRRLIRDTLDQLAEPLGKRRVVLALLLSVLAWGLWAAGAALVARSVGLQLSLLEAGFVAGAINLGVAVPSSPGFVGTYQWLGVAALGLFGVAQESALAFAILLHAAWYVPTTVVGGTALLLRGVGALRRRRLSPDVAGDRAMRCDSERASAAP